MQPETRADRGAGVSSRSPSLDWRRPEPAPSLVLRGAARARPARRDRPRHDIVIRDGADRRARRTGSTAEDRGGEEVDAEGLHAFPAFFDPHVHLRTPGREDKEDIETGTRAAAAGGFCGIARDGQHRPPVDDRVHVARPARAGQREASVPVGFLATVTRGMRGEELTEMAELREAGAVGFSDDGLPIAAPGCMRRALQYQRLVGGTIALHEEDPELSGDGVMHEGAVSAALGLAGIPSVSESTMIARDARARRLRGRPRPRPAPLGARVGRGGRARPRQPGRELTAEVDPAPPDAHRRGGAQPRRPLQDEPAAAHRGRPPGADRGRCAAGRSTASPPTTRRTRSDEKEVPFEAGGDGRDRARDRVRGPPHRAGRCPGSSSSGCSSSG